jgi:mRNA interferase MazF
MSPRPGEVWLADLGLAAKTRPVVIVSRYDPDSPRALVLYIPLTTQNRISPYEIPFPDFRSWTGIRSPTSKALVQCRLSVSDGGSGRCRLQ